MALPVPSINPVVLRDRSGPTRFGREIHCAFVGCSFVATKLQQYDDHYGIMHFCERCISAFPRLDVHFCGGGQSLNPSIQQDAFEKIFDRLVALYQELMTIFISLMTRLILAVTLRNNDNGETKDVPIFSQYQTMLNSSPESAILTKVAFINASLETYTMHVLRHCGRAEFYVVPRPVTIIKKLLRHCGRAEFYVVPRPVTIIKNVSFTSSRGRGSLLSCPGLIIVSLFLVLRHCGRAEFYVVPRPVTIIKKLLRHCGRAEFYVVPRPVTIIKKLLRHCGRAEFYVVPRPVTIIKKLLRHCGRAEFYVVPRPVTIIKNFYVIADGLSFTSSQDPSR
ncbi:hypothetical protein Fcan01_26053 [Folsomia candida]|uniref:Uncharacterized protein n=1 Tax=Folsomia candida TaxID=158441 RepID=A0A226D2B6_FOLCA|nr:hypothetical protein Fcan01_26053 [Folsomia candida]